MLVARVIAKLEPGGAQLSAFWCTKALRRHGIESYLLAGTANEAGLALAHEHGLEVEPFTGMDGVDLQWTPSQEFAEWLGARLGGADLIHAHMFGAWWAAAQVAPAGTPLAASEHNALAWPGRPRHREARAALVRVDRFFAHGPAAEAYVRALGYPPERLHRGRATFAGAGSRPLPGLPSPRIVFTGRLAPDKGPDVLVEALALMRDVPATFLVGEGRMRAALERRLRDAGIADRVTLCGWQSEPGRWVAGANVAVAPSRDEAWSQAVAMAMALGTPVVGTAVNGLPEVLSGDRGILVPPEDPEALAAALEGVVSGRLRTDVAAAREYAMDFTPSRLGRFYAEQYRELLAARAAAEPSIIAAG
jgi:glycosyltransferase involved in cell wall biosynthesis